MKKIILMLVFLMGVINVYADKTIYYPVYVTDIEVYHSDSLTRKSTIFRHPMYSLPMYQKGCRITVETPDIVDHIKKSIKLKRQANFAMACGIISASASMVNSVKAAQSNNVLTASLYLTSSYFYISNSYLNFDIMKRFKELSQDALIIPVKCTVTNESNKILRGNIIIKPKETQEISNTQYCDEWRFSDNEDNVYCIRMFSFVIKDKGYISRQLGVAFVKPTKSEKKTHKNQYKRINLKTYETKWVDKNDEELQTVKKQFEWDNGYN